MSPSLRVHALAARYADAYSVFGQTQPFQRWENFAEAVVVFVRAYGYRDAPDTVITFDKAFLDQMARMRALLEGWY